MGVGFGGCTRPQQLQLDLPAGLLTSAIADPRPSVSNSFLFPPFLSLCLSLKELSVSVSISVCLLPSLSFTRTHVIPLFY